jgi:hypothetical protein
MRLSLSMKPYNSSHAIALSTVESGANAIELHEYFDAIIHDYAGQMH